VLHIGDHDPSGVSMFLAFLEDVEAFARELGGQATFTRLAVTPAQIRKYRLPTAPPKATDRRAFAGETCQAEALPPNVLANILRTAIEERVDQRVLDRVLRQERRIRRELIKRLIEQLKRHATEMANANNAGMQGMSKREAMERVLPPPVRRHRGGTPAALARLAIAAAQRRARLPPRRAFRSRRRGHARAASNGPRTPDIFRGTKHRRHCSMPQPRRHRHGPQPDRRRALELLVSSRTGCTEALMLAHGFTVEQMVDLRIRTPTHGYEPTRRAALQVFAKSWIRE
jgi:hypothetical protein